MKKYALRAILLTLVVAVTSCGSVRTPIPDDLNEVIITLERTACFGACPVYRLTIYGNGRVVYEGIQFVRTKGIIETTIGEDSVRQLVSEFQEADYFALKDSYEQRMATDMPSAITSLTVNGRKKTVSHYHGDSSAPKKLTELENRIDDIVSSDQWVAVYPSQ
jgi:(2Fe-2S) ferredoxin